MAKQVQNLPEWHIQLKLDLWKSLYTPYKWQVNL